MTTAARRLAEAQERRTGIITGPHASLRIADGVALRAAIRACGPCEVVLDCDEGVDPGWARALYGMLEDAMARIEPRWIGRSVTSHDLAAMLQELARAVEL